MKIIANSKSAPIGTEAALEFKQRCRGALLGVGIASALVNVLYLSGSFFMLQVYDRVIPGRSIPSLIALAVLVAMLYAFQAAFDIARGRILTRIAGVFDQVMARHIFTATLQIPLRTKTTGDGLQLLRDFDQVKSFLGTSAPATLLDLPWIPIYIAICFMFHPIIGFMTIGGGIILAALSVAANMSTRRSAERIHALSTRRTTTLEAAQRNAEVVRALGMTGTLAERWLAWNTEYRTRSQQNADLANGYFALSKVFRMALQSAVLAAGAALVIENQATAGVIIASSILTARALSPVEQAIANARSYASARQSWRRMQEILKALPQAPFPTFLPAPRRSLVVEALASGAPGQGAQLVSGISFSVSAGSAVGVVGPSASGKSTLARALTGVWPILHGNVRLDGAALDQWDESSLGRHIGYLPQDIELFAGTVADNISRFQPNAASDDIIVAARAAGVHDLILRLANGYDTEIGAGGSMLSAGQRQRIGLARALYGNPFLVVLDEPNSNLDADGEAAVSSAIMGIRSRGGIAIVIAHRPSALSATDCVLMIRDGHMHLFGKKEDVLNSLMTKNIRSVSVERGGALRVTDGTEESAS